MWARQLLASDEQSTITEPELMHRQYKGGLILFLNRLKKMRDLGYKLYEIHQLIF
jgi:hypothetical protein